MLDFIRKLLIKLIWYNNVSLIKTRCRASRRGEVFLPVGVRLPKPYENVHLCLEFAIYQTHVIIPFLIIYLSFVPQTFSLCCPEPHFIKTGNATLIFRIGIIPFLVIYHSYVAQTFSLCPIPPHFVKFGNATSFFRIGIIPFLVIYHSYVAQTFSLCPIPPHFVKFGNATSFFRIGIICIFYEFSIG